MAGDRIAVLGAGSVGCFIGGCWQEAGLPVTFIGRPKIARDIHDHGLTLTDYTGWERKIGDIDFACVPAPLAEAGIILLTVKSGATEEAAREIADNGRDGALVISFQNGISNVDVLRARLGERFRIVRGMVVYNVAYLGRGHFHKGVAGELWAERRPETEELAEQVGAGAGSLKLSEEMLGLAWGKLLINLNNAINALSGVTLVEELTQRDYRRVLAAAQREGLRLLKRAGIRPAKVGAVGPKLLPLIVGSPDWLFRNLFMKAWKIDSKARSSMSDDLAAGRTTEVEFLNGELVRLAERLGLSAPINRKIVDLVHQAEGGAGPLGPVELRRAALGR